MCGIAGLLRFDGIAVHESDLKTILNKMEHRGNDHCGILLGSKLAGKNAKISTSIEIGLGHRRLSIIDLHESASQPMFYADSNLCLTYNGEIYNYLELKKFLREKSYHFTTQSDTEVILAAYHYWGEKCVDHFNGMYAFAVWDEVNKQLFCARDPLGIKPFYYRKTPHWFAFASESLALTHLDDPSLNSDALLSYFLSTYVAIEESIFTGIKKLPPAHRLLIDSSGKILLEKFWSIEQFERTPLHEHSMEHLDLLIKKSIRQQLHSDVPVGGFLSGGVDSGLITALASPHAKKYFTYSVAYEGLLDSELPYARKVAEKYDTEHKEIIITASDAMINLDQALKSMSEPVADPAIVATYLLSKIAASDGVKVLLNGTGGDEIFGGYTRYTGQLSVKRRMLNALPQLMQHWLGSLACRTKTKTRLKYPALDMMFSAGGSYLLANKFLKNSRYLTEFLIKLSLRFKSASHDNIPLLYQRMLFDMQFYLPDELLFILDQMTMAHTVEGRVPLLDVDVIQSSFNFSANTHVHHNQTKIILKKIAEPYLGIEHIQRKKQGFSGSVSWWVNKNYKEFIQVIAELNTIPHFEDFNINSFLKFDNINEKKSNDIFILYCVAKWYEGVKSKRRTRE